MTTAQHLDAALEHLRAIGHGHDAEELTRRHIEFASAHLREAWIADDGQNATTPEATHKAVAGFYRLEDKLAAARAHSTALPPRSASAPIHRLV